MPGIEPGASRMQSERSTTELHPPDVQEVLNKQSYLLFFKWYLIPPYLTLSDIRYVSRVVEQSRERSRTLPYTSV